MLFLKKAISCVLLVGAALQGIAQSKITVSNTGSAGAFPLIRGKQTTTIYTDINDAEVVQIAANCFRKDVQMVTGILPVIQTSAPAIAYPVIAGTIGQSKIIDQLIRDKKVNADAVKGKWETFNISVVNNPLPNVKQALVIFGSDRRGTAFGFFELSRMMGVSPLNWWADVTPKHHDEIYITPGNSIIGPPSVKFRGIFINDEDWGMQPWAAKNMDKDIKDIGPNTYARIFELLLRLKANYIWPAMHPCTKAFWYYKENPIVADKYAIVLGASHCEPILRDNVFEWADNYENEFGQKPGEWRYDVNKAQIYNFWDVRAKASAKIDAVYTVGMRGIHDGSMPGPKSKPEKVKLLETVIADQRELLSKNIAKPADNIPQLFCPYKEVLDLYQMNMKLPEDITIVWADDNHGYVRQVSDASEQKRSGGSGVYYHLSYWGAPKDYLWLESNSPSLISYEMSKAYQFGADKIWIFNVGDLKPAEMETQFSMDLAWDIKSWTPEKAYDYPKAWATETFGAEYADAIAHIKHEYYHLANAAKPEHMDAVQFTEAEMNQRLTDYQKLRKEAEDLKIKIPAALQDAYFELILYPVSGACLMNEKILYAKKSLKMVNNTFSSASLPYSQKATNAFNEIGSLTKQYNEVIAGGKWNGIMSDHPRDQKAFKRPFLPTDQTVTPEKSKDQLAAIALPLPPKFTITADQYVAKHEVAGTNIETIQGLGINGKAVTVMPIVQKSYMDNIKASPYLDYKVDLSDGNNSITVKCLPTFRLYRGFGLHYAISVNGDEPQVINVDSPADSKVWGANVLRGYSVGQTTHQGSKNGEGKVRIYLLDPSLVLSQIEVSPLAP
ncbi:MAG: glycosyl hydrolase 115 family protein [Mucilaginibacter sp.]|uniref:glycosyl hydrolase 115 family protein n=1 Tax=Mucilaginibacter sp. TaxID=1882438 RepID=UPI003265435D